MASRKSKYLCQKLNYIICLYTCWCSHARITFTITSSNAILYDSQVGYWNEEEKYVNTASFVRGPNDTYGLQNRTYIVTTILVSPRYREENRRRRFVWEWGEELRQRMKGSLTFSFNWNCVSKSLKKIQRTAVVISPILLPFLPALLCSLSCTDACLEW